MDHNENQKPSPDASPEDKAADRLSRDLSNFETTLSLLRHMLDDAMRAVWADGMEELLQPLGGSDEFVAELGTCKDMVEKYLALAGDFRKQKSPGSQSKAP